MRTPVTKILQQRGELFLPKKPPIELYTKALWREFGIHAQKSDESVFSRTCAGKRHLKSRERGDEREVHGEKTWAYMKGIRAA